MLCTPRTATTKAKCDNDVDDNGGSERRVYEFYDFTREVHLGPYISHARGIQGASEKKKKTPLNQCQPAALISHRCTISSHGAWPAKRHGRLAEMHPPLNFLTAEIQGYKSCSGHVDEIRRRPSRRRDKLPRFTTLRSLLFTTNHHPCSMSFEKSSTSRLCGWKLAYSLWNKRETRISELGFFRFAE